MIYMYSLCITFAIVGYFCYHICMMIITTLYLKLLCLFFCICRFYVGRKAMFDSDFKAGLSKPLFITLTFMFGRSIIKISYVDDNFAIVIIISKN